MKVFGAEFLIDYRAPEFESRLLFDIGIDWSANILDLVIIPQDHPLAIRYKPSVCGSPTTTGAVSQWSLRPSRSIPMTFDIDIGQGVDLGVMSVDRASVRAYLGQPRRPELTALAARVDATGAIVGSGYLRIGTHVDPQGHSISTNGGQIDITLRPVNLHIAAALEIANIPPEAGARATGVYVGLNLVLPAGIPLGPTGIGILGFRGMFGMHYQRNPKSVPRATCPRSSG